VGDEIANTVKGSEMDIRITHYDHDDFNGVYRSSTNFQNIRSGNMFVSNSVIPKPLNEFAKERNIKICTLGKQAGYAIHNYGTGESEKINILWPNIAFHSKDVNREEFLNQQFPNWSKINGINPSVEKINRNYMSLVFEVKGINEKWCLFSGDVSDKFDPYARNQEIRNNYNNYVLDLLPPLLDKYSFIKAPHHGIESWPLKSAAQNCEVLITMADTGDNSPISPDYLSSKSIKKIYMMNCMDCYGEENIGAGSKCTACTSAVIKVHPYLTINL